LRDTEVAGSNCDKKPRKGGNRVDVLRRKSRRWALLVVNRSHPRAFTGAAFAGAFVGPETDGANVPERWRGWRLGRWPGFRRRSIPAKERMPRLR
ncbi:hypothetical protein BHE74_00047066, partial [Ensete ventricosum]